MRKGTPIAAVLVLALLAQAAASVGRAPCMMNGQHPVTPASHQHPDHTGARSAHVAVAGHDQHAAHHQMTAKATADPTAPVPGGDCCYGMTVMGCATGSCTPGGGTILMRPLPVVAGATLVYTAYRAPEWLPPYLTLSATIFRPPIA